MNILFICRHNRFRSKVAECIFNALNKNKEIHAESAGFIKDEAHPYIEENVIKIMKSKGYDIKGKPRQMSNEMARNFGRIIVVADDVPDVFDGFKGKAVRWDIPDCSISETGKIREIIDRIETRVKELLKNI